MQRAASCFIAGVLVLVAGGGVYARTLVQGPDQSVDLAPFQDSVQRIRDVDALRVMLARRSSRDAEKSPVALTERGFVALRLWDLTMQRSHSRLAEESFKQALKQQPQSGWAHYGLGLAYVSGPGAHPEKAGWRGAFVLDDVFQKTTGNDVRSRAHREFIKAIAAEPPVSRAADELAENAVTKNKRKTLEDARDVLLGRTAAAPTDGELWYGLARVQTELGALDEALDAMNKATAAGYAAPALAHARASLLVRMHGHEDEGATAWLASLEHLTTAMSEEYFADIEPLLSNDEKDSWTQMDPGARATFLREFWPVRAALGGVTVAQRMSDHYRRLAHARAVFFRDTKYGAPDMNALRQLPFSQRSDYDDRGLIYIRHGAPRERIGAGRGGYESWGYAGIDGVQRLFHFEEDDLGGSYHLMHKLTCDPAFVEQREVLSARLGLLALNCNPRDVLSLSADMRQIAFEALATDTDRPNFTKELPFYFDLYTFRATEGRTDVLAAVAVPRGRLNITEVSTNSSYRIDLSLILVDTLSRRVTREDDSLWVKSKRTVTDSDLLRLHVEIAVPPSRSTLQRLIVSDPTEPGVGQLAGGPFPVPDYSGPKLMLSDVVLAEPGVEGRYHRGDVALALVPTGYFKGGSFNVFYEIYNIKQNDRYSTEIEIEPVRKKTGDKLKGLFGAGRDPIKLRFDGVASSVRNGVLQELRRVDAPLGTGTYRMRVLVKNIENGEMSKNERVFVIP